MKIDDVVLRVKVQDVVLRMQQLLEDFSLDDLRDSNILLQDVKSDLHQIWRKANRNIT